MIRSPTNLPADPALTAHGVEQARELAAHLLTVRPPISQVFSSPYYRCLQTVEPFVQQQQQQHQHQRKRATEEERSSSSTRSEAAHSAHQLDAKIAKIRCETGLSEWYGTAPFLQPVPAPISQLQVLFPATVDEAYVSVLAPSRKGETIAQLHDRVAAALEGLIERCDREGHRAVLLCTHAAVVIALGRVLTGTMPNRVEAEDFAAFTCGLSVYRRRSLGKKTPEERCRSVDEETLVVDRQTKSGERVSELRLGGEVETWDTQSTRRQGGASHSFLSPDATATSLNDHNKPILSDSPPASVKQEGQSRSQSHPVVAWRNGRGVGGGWDVELNGDCSFLSGGEERGWYVVPPSLPCLTQACSARSTFMARRGSQIS